MSTSSTCRRAGSDIVSKRSRMPLEKASPERHSLYSMWHALTGVLGAGLESGSVGERRSVSEAR